MTEPTVVVSNIAKHYGNVQALRDVSFSLNEGEMVALVGHNGAGKTTLIKLMLGLIRPSGGSIRVMGEDPASGAFAVRQSLGYLPESVAFHNALTGRETLAFYATLKQVHGSDTMGLLESVGLGAEAAARPVRTYSKGMRQRLGLAQALLGQPRLLLLDEPTSGLDPASRRKFYDLLTELKSQGASILLSSHALTELEDRADRLLIVNEGVAVADGTMDDLRGIARLPTRISVTLAHETAAMRLKNEGLVWEETSPGTLETSVSNEEKIGVLRHITISPGDVAALHIVEPTLDDLYAHFLSAGKKTA